MSPGRVANLTFALVLGVLVACAFNIGDEDALPPPEPRCGGLTLEACIARVERGELDAGTD